MRKIIIVAAGALALAGCTTAQLQQIEADALAVAAKIRAGARVAAADVKAALDGVCNNGAAINAGVQNVKAAIAGLGSGPKTQQNLNAADRSLAVLNAACAAAPGGTTSSVVALFQQGYAAYLAAKNAANAATAAAAKGT